MAERIDLTFLGTGPSIPTARSNHPVMLLRYKKENILFDCGEGTQRQFRKAKLNPCNITRILITHWHGDHVFGLPGLLSTLRMNGYNGKLEIYGPKGTKEWMRKYLDLVGGRGEDLDLKVIEVGNGIAFDEGEYFVEAMEMDHDCPCLGYSFVVREKSRLDVEKLKKLKIPNSPLLGELAAGKTVTIDGKKVDGKKLLYTEDARKVTFIMDTRICTGAVKLSKGADLLVIESTFSKEESQELLRNRAHLSSAEATEIAKKAKVKSLVLTHLSQRYDGIPNVILKEAKDYLKGTEIGVIIPEDLDMVEL